METPTTTVVDAAPSPMPKPALTTAYASIEAVQVLFESKQAQAAILAQHANALDELLHTVQTLQSEVQELRLRLQDTERSSYGGGF